MSGGSRSTQSAAAVGSPAAGSQFALTQPDESLAGGVTQAQLDPALTQLLQTQTEQQVHQSKVIKELHDKLEALQTQFAASDSAPASASPLASAARLQQPQ